MSQSAFASTKGVATNSAAKIRSAHPEAATLVPAALPPFGYVITIDSETPDDRLFEMTHLARYRYDELEVLQMRPVILDTPTFVPGDYRTPEQVVREADLDA